MDGSPMIVPCILSLAKWSVLTQAQQDPQPPTWFADKDDPLYKLKRPKYVQDMNGSIESDYYRCIHADVFRLKFGKGVRKHEDKSVAVPVLWPELTVSAKIVITSIGSFFPNITKVWPEIIMPFLFTLMSVACAILLILPILLLGGFCWALLYNLRFIGHRKIRLAMRSFLIKKENWRRWYYEQCFPPQHLRKFRERDRFQMPDVFQHPDLSSDDEPEELQRLHILRQKTTMWTKKEIDMLGFDPDNIAMEKIYGDLLGTPAELAPEVRDYIKNKKVVSDDAKASITSDEWVQALRSRVEEIQAQSNDSMLRSFWSRINTEASQLFNTPVFRSQRGSKVSKTSSGNSYHSIELPKQNIDTNKKVSKPKTNQKPPARPSTKISRITGKKQKERNLSVRDISAQPMPSAPKFWVSKKVTPVRKSSQALGRLNPTYTISANAVTRIPSPLKLNSSKTQISDSNSPTQVKADTEEPKQKSSIKPKHWFNPMKQKPQAPVETKSEEAAKPKTDARHASVIDSNAPNQQVRASATDPNQQVRASATNDPNQQVRASATNDPNQQARTSGTNDPNQQVRASATNDPNQQVRSSATNYPKQQARTSGTSNPKQHVRASRTSNPKQQVRASIPNDPNYQARSSPATANPDINFKDEKKNSFPKTDPNQPRKSENQTSAPKADQKKYIVDNTILEPVLRQDQDSRKSQPQEGVSFNPKRDDDNMEPQEAPEQLEYKNVPKDGPKSKQNPYSTLLRSPIVFRGGKRNAGKK